VAALECLLPVAQEAKVILGVEPEPANVIACAARARKLLDELQSPNLKIIFDAANLLGACLENARGARAVAARSGQHSPFAGAATGDLSRSGPATAVPNPALSADWLGFQKAVLQEAVDLLGPDIVLAHAKDLACGSRQAQIPAGRGELDYDLYLSILHDAGYRGPLILHGLLENEVDEAAAFVRTRLRRCSAGLPG
jgi:sugar phosphate isomerase/epimerase